MKQNNKDYVHCGVNGEHLFHVFVDCPFACAYWEAAGINLVSVHAVSFDAWMMTMFNYGDSELRLKFCMLL